jgi:hypothetical protein
MIPFNEDLINVLRITKAYRSLPEGNYALIEFYCANPDCDCQGGAVEVLALDDINKSNSDSTLALIDFSWGNKLNHSWKFRLHNDSPKTRMAKTLLKCFKIKVKQDKNYADSLIKHYQMVKGHIKYISQEQSSAKITKIGRNEPCPCGSGKKYKKCCLNK